jgi:hypothetical protein
VFLAAFGLPSPPHTFENLQKSARATTHALVWTLNLFEKISILPSVRIEDVVAKMAEVKCSLKKMYLASMGLPTTTRTCVNLLQKKTGAKVNFKKITRFSGTGFDLAIRAN